MPRSVLRCANVADAETAETTETAETAEAVCLMRLRGRVAAGPPSRQRNLPMHLNSDITLEKPTNE